LASAQPCAGNLPSLVTNPNVPNRSFSVLAILTATLIAQVARAQDSTRVDSLPFRKGQWAGQFTASSEHSNVGVLRFRSPRVAWLINGNVSLSNQTDHGSGQADSSTYSDRQQRTASHVSMRLGRRVYHPLAYHAGGFYSLGITGGGGWSRDTQSFTISPPVPGTGSQQVSSSEWHGGVFAEIGASYLIIDHVSLGMITSIESVYTATRITGNQQRHGHILSLSTDVLSIVATVYF
jgi:hypothetical protein